MKKIIFLALVIGLFSCKKDEDPFSIDLSSLPGTYWRGTELYFLGQGHDQVNVYDPGSGWDGGAGPSELLFDSNGSIIEYCRVASVGYPFIKFYYREDTYTYNPETKVFNSQLHTLKTSTSVVSAWTPSRLEFIGYDPQGEPYSRQVFQRFDPDEAWLQKVAAWPNYDDIDWGSSGQ